MVVAFLRKGKLSNFEKLKIKLPILIIGAFIVQLLVPIIGRSQYGSLNAFYLLLLSYVILLIVMWYNHKTPFFSLICVGLFLNFLVIAVNGGMPVSKKSIAMAEFKKEVTDFKGFNDYIHLEMNKETRLPFLADVIPLPAPPGLRTVISIGDIILSLGIFLFIQKGMIYQGKRIRKRKNE